MVQPRILPQLRLNLLYSLSSPCHPSVFAIAATSGKSSAMATVHVDDAFSTIFRALFFESAGKVVRDILDNHL